MIISDMELRELRLLALHGENILTASAGSIASGDSDHVRSVLVGLSQFVARIEGRKVVEVYIGEAGDCTAA